MRKIQRRDFLKAMGLSLIHILLPQSSQRNCPSRSLERCRVPHSFPQTAQFCFANKLEKNPIMVCSFPCLLFIRFGRCRCV